MINKCEYQNICIHTSHPSVPKSEQILWFHDFGIFPLFEGSIFSGVQSLVFKVDCNRPRGQGDHFQTQSEGHFQTQSSLDSIFTGKDSILGPRKRRVISKHKQGVIFKHNAKIGGSFSNTGILCAARESIFRTLNKLSLTWRPCDSISPCRLTTGGDWGLGTGLGLGGCFGSGSGGVIFKHNAKTRWSQASFELPGTAFSGCWISFLWHENYVTASPPRRLTRGGLGFRDGAGAWGTPGYSSRLHQQATAVPRSRQYRTRAMAVVVPGDPFWPPMAKKGRSSLQQRCNHPKSTTVHATRDMTNRWTFLQKPWKSKSKQSGWSVGRYESRIPIPSYQGVGRMAFRLPGYGQIKMYMQSIIITCQKFQEKN